MPIRCLRGGGEAAFTPTDSNVLVACFSATGNTWPLAEYAADYLNADLFRIEPEELYTDADLNYNNNKSRANREMNDDMMSMMGQLLM